MQMAHEEHVARLVEALLEGVVVHVAEKCASADALVGVLVEERGELVQKVARLKIKI